MEQARAREATPSSPAHRRRAAVPPGARAEGGAGQAPAPPSSAAARPLVPEPARGEHTHSEPDAPRAPEPRRDPAYGAPGRGAVSYPSGPHRTAPHPAPHPGVSHVVRRHSVRGQILQALRTALAEGELTPGEVYSAPVLGERFGVSATPVREAMQQLAAEGAIEVVPNRGFKVTVRSPRELGELAEVRALIEAPVLLRLARTVPAGRWARLRPLADVTAAAAADGDCARYAEADRAFHRALLAPAGNEQLLAVADDLHRRSQGPLPGAPVARRAALAADAAEHTALLDALCAGDLAAVHAVVRRHFPGAGL